MTETPTLAAMDPGPEAPRAGPWDLFWGFASIGIVGFGGVMPWVRWLLVERRGWCSEEEFNNVFALANFLPGGNVVSVSVLIGARMAGFPGALAAIIGLVAPPAILVCLVGGLYLRYQDVPAVAAMLSAMAASAAGLIVAMGLRMVWPLRKSPRALVFVAAVMLASAVLRLPLIWTLGMLLPASLLAARFLRN